MRSIKNTVQTRQDKCENFGVKGSRQGVGH